LDFYISFFVWLIAVISLIKIGIGVLRGRGDFKNSNGEFLNHNKKFKVPKRGITKIDINYVYNIITQRISNEFLSYGNIDKSYLEKFRPIDNNIEIKIEEDNKESDLMKKLNKGESIYIEYLNDLPDEVKLDIISDEEGDEEDILFDSIGNINTKCDDFEPYGDLWDSESDGNDSSYFYHIYTACSKNYKITIRTGSYIKDQCICNPRGISQFKITKI
jgi:hypothetical protein